MGTSFLLQRYHGNRRSDVRIKTQLPAHLRILQAGTDAPLDDVTCMTSDVSLHGARLVIHSNKPILNNTSVEFLTGKSFFGWKYRLAGIIRWIQREPGTSHGILGVFFRDLPPSSEKAWTKFLLKEAHRLKLSLDPEARVV